MEHFAHAVRRRALDYVGEFFNVCVYGGWATAMVVGTRAYEVEADWETEDAPGSCTCPYFEKHGPCKHMWALLVTLDPAEAHELVVRDTGLERVPSKAGAPRETQEPRQPREPWRRRLESLRKLAQGRERSFNNPWDVGGAQRYLRYQLGGGVVADEGEVGVWPLLRTRLKSGAWGKPRGVAIENIRPADIGGPQAQRMHRLLCSQSSAPIFDYGYSARRREYESQFVAPLTLEAETAFELLPRLAALGLLEVGRRDGEFRVLEWDDGPPWRIERVLEETEEGEAILSARLVRDSAPPGSPTETAEMGEPPEAIELADLCFVLEQGLFATFGRLARLESARAFAWISQIVQEGGPLSVPQDQVGELRRLTDEIAPVGEGQTPSSGALVEMGSPVPHLHVDPPAVAGLATRVECRIVFHYGTSSAETPDASDAPGVSPSSTEPVVRGTNGRTIGRNLEAEQECIRQYIAVGGSRDQREHQAGSDGTLAHRKLVQSLGTLLSQGWEITAEGRRLRQPGEFSVSVSSGIDWFDLEGAMAFGDQQASLPELLRAHRSKTNLVKLGDGTFGVLPEDWLAKWGVVTLADGHAQDADGDALRFRSNQGWLLDMLLAGREQVTFDAGFERYRKNLAGFDGVRPKREPKGFTGELRDYQREALGWFAFLRVMGLGGCLADDMGLGKTVQVLALLESRRRPKTCGPSLVVVPRSLVYNWIDEAARFTPKLRVLDYSGPDRKALRTAAGTVDLLVTTYGALRRDAPALVEETFDYLILDEATAIKNAASQASKAARLLSAEHRLSLTGTPIENHIGELWSQLEFLNPGMLGRSSVFKSFVAASGSAGGTDGGKGDTEGASAPERHAELAKALRPFILRRTKDEVLKELPPKSEQIVLCELSKKEERRYAELRQHYQASLLGGGANGEGKVEGSKIHILEALLRLRQAACHPGLLDAALTAESSAKLEVLLPRLAELAEEGHKVLVFSQFTTFLGIVRQRLDDAGIAYEYLDGRTRNRKEKVERFESDPKVPVFLISLKAGGHGLNLTAADYVFLLDPWWNPAVESQAVDRAHRMGQTRPVSAYRLIAKGTVEQRVLELQDDKRALAASLLGDGQGVIRNLTREDLRVLLS